MKSFYFVFFMFFLISLVLSACSSTGLVAGTAYTVYADRLPTDDMLSIVTGKDCNTVRADREQTSICRDPAEVRNANRVVEPPIWCYRSIGVATCYGRPIEGESAELIR